jgi:predicted nucleic acid-binding protein
VSVVYFDASALVKLFIDESGSEIAAQLWDGSAARLSSRLAYPEVCAALGAGRRNRLLSRAGYLSAREIWEQLWDTMRPVGLTPGVERLAGDLAGDLSLRGASAVHLASAMSVAADDFVVAAWDRRLRSAALAEGLAVVPAAV